MPTHLRRCDVPGHAHFWTISCFHRLGFFWLDDVKQVAVDGLKRLRTKHGICLIAYVIMPDHVHIVFYPHAKGCDQPVPVSTRLRDYKQFVGFHGKEQLRNYWRVHRGLWSDALNSWARGDLGAQSLWNDRGYDFNIHNHHTLIEKVEYCHNNPVKRGLVQSAEDWEWSSCRCFTQRGSPIVEMDWKGEYPIQW